MRHTVLTFVALAGLGGLLLGSQARQAPPCTERLTKNQPFEFKICFTPEASYQKAWVEISARPGTPEIKEIQLSEFQASPEAKTHGYSLPIDGKLIAPQKIQIADALKHATEPETNKAKKYVVTLVSHRGIESKIDFEIRILDR